MNGPRSDGSQAARTGFRPEVLQALWDVGPDRDAFELLQSRYGSARVSRRAGRETRPKHSSGFVGVPEPIRTELAWCVFRIIDQGGRVDIGHMRMLVSRLSDVISDLGPQALLPR